MQKYFYTKSVDSEVLNEAICLRTSLRKVIVGVLVSDELKPDGTPIDNNIELQFTRALTSAEQDEITNIINAVGPTYDLMIRKNIENDTMAWAMKQGQTILAQFGANNLFRGKTNVQVDALVTQYPDLIHSLVTGSLSATYRIFSAMTPDANISQEEIDEFKLRLAIVLGL